VRPERRGLTAGISPLWLRVGPVEAEAAETAAHRSQGAASPVS
jgi:hypothetical protein